jgi:ATP-binding cassette subfamily B protein
MKEAAARPETPGQANFSVPATCCGAGWLGKSVTGICAYWRRLSQSFGVFWRLLRYIRSDRKRIAGILAIMMVTGLAGALSPLLAKLMVDKVLPGQRWDLFWIITGVVFGLSFALDFLKIWQDYLSMCMQQRLRAVLSVAHLRRVLMSPLWRIEQQQVGAHIFRATNDVEAAGALTTSWMSFLAAGVLPLVAALIAMGSLNCRLTLAYFLLMPLLIAVRVWSALKLQPCQQRLRHDDERIRACVGQIIATAKLAKMNGEELAQVSRYLGILRQNIGLQFDLWRKRVLLGRIEWLLNSGTGGILQWWLWFSVMRQYESLGSAMAVSIYFGLILGPFMGLGAFIQAIVGGGVAGQRLLEQLGEPSERLHEGLPVPWRDGGMAIRLEKVAFAYPAHDWVLHDVSLDLEKGSVTVLIGPSGAGKTTLLNLIAGLSQRQGGRLWINEVPFEELRLSSWRRLVALIPQDITIIEGTAIENIGCAFPGATRDDVRQAAIKATIHDRIMAMPEQYDTRLRGNRDLSAGEAQRFALARVFLRRNPVMLMDEPFANLDPASADRVMASILQVREETTTLVVTHDLKWLAQADRVVVLNRGRIVYRGTPGDVALRDIIDPTQIRAEISA